MNIYDDMDADVLQNYQKYNLSNDIYCYLKESAAMSTSARMMAVNNASKRPSDMITKLMLMFSRTCQAVITKEMIEIICGATVLD
jgi:ATP synthase F1 gamma subunit